MGKAEERGTNAVQMATGVALGGLLALGIELMILLLGSLAVSNGILKEDAAPQLTAAACVLGCFGGGLLACAKPEVSPDSREDLELMMSAEGYPDPPEASEQEVPKE